MKSFTSQIPSAFIWRRVHSLAGFWLVLFLIVHLITNVQASLWIGDDGEGFIRMVNFLEALPFLVVVEAVLIGIPLLIHIIWGCSRVLTARLNVASFRGNVPALFFERNFAFTLQRISSWVLVIGLIGHLVQMKWLNAPKEVKGSFETHYFACVAYDSKVSALAEKMHTILLTPSDIVEARQYLQKGDFKKDAKLQDQSKRTLILEQKWLEMASSFHPKNNQVIAVSNVAGKSFLFIVRDLFKNPVIALLYTLFVLAAAFHAFNGLWAFLITWGFILSYRFQKSILPLSFVGIIILGLLGLSAIWCTYWIEFR